MPLSAEIISAIAIMDRLSGSENQYPNLRRPTAEHSGLPFPAKDRELSRLAGRSRASSHSSKPGGPGDIRAHDLGLEPVGLRIGNPTPRRWPEIAVGPRGLLMARGRRQVACRDHPGRPRTPPGGTRSRGRFGSRVREFVARRQAILPRLRHEVTQACRSVQPRHAWPRTVGEAAVQVLERAAKAWTCSRPGNR